MPLSFSAPDAASLAFHYRAAAYYIATMLPDAELADARLCLRHTLMRPRAIERFRGE